MNKNIEDKYHKNRKPSSSCLLNQGPPHKPDRNILHTQSHDHLRLHHTLAHLLPRLPGLRNHLHLEVPQKQREPADGFDDLAEEEEAMHAYHAYHEEQEISDDEEYPVQQAGYRRNARSSQFSTSPVTPKRNSEG